MKRNFFWKSKGFDAQRIVAYNFSTSEKKINMENLIDDSFFGQHNNSSYYVYNSTSILENYKDIPNSAGDLANDMFRWLYP